MADSPTKLARADRVERRDARVHRLARALHLERRLHLPVARHRIRSNESSYPRPRGRAQLRAASGRPSACSCAGPRPAPPRGRRTCSARPGEVGRVGEAQPALRRSRACRRPCEVASVRSSISPSRTRTDGSRPASRIRLGLLRRALRAHCVDAARSAGRWMRLMPTCVPPTVMLSMRTVGRPTPTGTLWPSLPQVPRPGSGMGSLPDRADVLERLRPHADERRALHRPADLAVLNQVRLAHLEDEVAVGDVHLAAAEVRAVQALLHAPE